MPRASATPGWRFLVYENLPEQLVTYLRAEGYAAEHAYDVGLRGRHDPEVFAYVRMAAATLITQDHDLERDTDQFPRQHPGLVLVELPQSWP